MYSPPYEALIQAVKNRAPDSGHITALHPGLVFQDPKSLNPKPLDV